MSLRDNYSFMYLVRAWTKYTPLSPSSEVIFCEHSKRQKESFREEDASLSRQIVQQNLPNSLDVWQKKALSPFGYLDDYSQKWSIDNAFWLDPISILPPNFVRREMSSVKQEEKLIPSVLKYLKPEIKNSSKKSISISQSLEELTKKRQ